MAASGKRQRGQRKPAAGGRRLTRREVLAAAAGLALAGCASSTVTKRKATPTPAPFALGRAATLFVAGTVPPALVAPMRARLAGIAGFTEVTLAGGLTTSPDLVLTFGALPAGFQGATAGPSPLTILTHLRVPVDGVSAAAARALLAGEMADWRAAGAPYSLPVHVFALADLPLPASLRLAAGARVLPDVPALLDALRAIPGSIAALPLEAADWSVRNLGVDGIFPAQGRGKVTTSALAPFALQVGVAEPLAKRGLRAQPLADALAPLLAIGVPVLDLAAVGDIMLGRGVNNKMLAHGDYRYPYRQVRDELMSADLRVANLECTITDLVPVPTDPFTFNFVSARRAVDGLTFAGFSAVTVANNHAGGAGTETLADMLGTLRGHGIAATGGGAHLAAARTPALMEAQGLRVALLGYDGIPPQCPFATASSPGLAPIDLATLPGDIAAARQQADLVIPYFHWGIEYTKDPTREQQQAARAAIDAGADMVLGVHPHWVQGIESYKGRLIVYALGNFIFDQDWSRPTLEGMLLHLYWRGTTLAGLRFVPVIDEDRCQPRVMSPGEAVDVFERMWSGTDMLARGQYGPEPEP
jgi:poly-gamma-glutamate capsule biosynthesis protein CapA/YwtB (metallophosphatase superfamily)